MRNLVLFLLFICFTGRVSAQLKVYEIDTFNQNRLNAVAITVGGAYVASSVGLYYLWYHDYPTRNFHFRDDFYQWNQVDKFGHLYATYYEAQILKNMLRWTGMDDNKVIAYSAIGAFFIQLPIEIMDGFSNEWGASYSDLVANAMGSGLFYFQEKRWGEQRIKLKFSYMPTIYSDIRPNLLGSGFHEEILKDYNGQTYWLSTSTHHIFGNEKFKWLALAGGYGATGMTGGSSNPLPNYYNREREFYFGLDVDLSQIPTQKKGVKVLLEILNCIKFPAPTLEFETDGTIQFHYLFL